MLIDEAGLFTPREAAAAIEFIVSDELTEVILSLLMNDGLSLDAMDDEFLCRSFVNDGRSSAKDAELRCAIKFHSIIVTYIQYIRVYRWYHEEFVDSMTASFRKYYAITSMATMFSVLYM